MWWRTSVLTVEAAAVEVFHRVLLGKCYVTTQSQTENRSKKYTYRFLLHAKVEKAMSTYG